MFSPFGYGAGYYGDSDDEYYDDGYNHKPVDFLRPDGDTETKDVQWCLDNNFFQVHDGLGGEYPLWSGNWYYKKHPEEKHMHQQRLKDTKQIRRRNEQRSRVSSARSEYEEVAEKEMEAAFRTMLQDDLTRMGYPSNYLSDKGSQRWSQRQKPTEARPNLASQRQNDIRKETDYKQPPSEFKPFKFGNQDEKNSSFGRSDGFNFRVGSSASAVKDDSTSTSRHQFTFDTASTGNDSGFRFKLDHVTKKSSAPFVFGEAKSKSMSTETSTALSFGNNDKNKRKSSDGSNFNFTTQTKTTRGIIVKSADTDEGQRFISEVDSMLVQGKSVQRVAFDCEGVCLSRIGSVELVSICFPNLDVYLIDLNGTACPRVVQAMESLFESEAVLKIIHDCKMDCDALYHHHEIILNNVHDTSCFHDIITNTENTNLNNVLIYNGINVNTERDTSVYKKNPRFWSDRPLTDKMISWATADVDKLFVLADRQLGCISDSSKAKALAKSTKYTATARDMKVVSGLSVRNPGRFIGKGGANLRSLTNRTNTHVYQHEGEWTIYYNDKSALEAVLWRMSDP